MFLPDMVLCVCVCKLLGEKMTFCWSSSDHMDSNWAQAFFWGSITYCVGVASPKDTLPPRKAEPSLLEGGGLWFVFQLRCRERACFFA